MAAVAMPPRSKREHDAQEDLRPAATVNQCGFNDLVPEVPHERGRQPDDQWYADAHVNDDEAKPRVEQIKRAQREVERDGGRHWGHHARRQEPHLEVFFSLS
jgi:hypothetical protein